MRLKMFITTVLMGLVLTACQAGLSEGEVRAIAAEETAKLLEALRPQLIGPPGAKGEVGPQGPPGTPADPDVIRRNVKSEGFQLVDKDGVVRAALHMRVGGPALELYSSDGQTSLATVGLDLSSDAELTLRQSDGALLARIGSIADRNFLVLGDTAGAKRIELFADVLEIDTPSSDFVGVYVYGPNGGTPIVEMGTDLKNGFGRLDLSGPGPVNSRSPRFLVSIGEGLGGGGKVSLYDGTTNTITASLTASEEGGLLLRDGQGKSAWFRLHGIRMLDDTGVRALFEVDEQDAFFALVDSLGNIQFKAP